MKESLSTGAFSLNAGTVHGRVDELGIFEVTCFGIPTMPQ